MPAMSAELAFVFADLAGYTAMTEAHGDDDAAHVATRFHELATACLCDGTRLVKTIGDAVMLVAPAAADAIATALALSRHVLREPSFPAVRIGLHVGPAVERERDYFGATVNTAARVAGIARGGEIVCTEAIASVAVTLELAAARPLGTVRLKNVVAPIALYELTVEDAIPHDAELRHIDPVCRMQVTAQRASAQLTHDGATLYFCSSGCATSFACSPETYVPPPKE